MSPDYVIFPSEQFNSLGEGMCDGKIGMADALYVLRVAAGVKTP